MLKKIYTKDTIRGGVIKSTDEGIYLILENGQYAFACFSPLPYGTEVVCTVLKQPTQNRLMIVSIDSVCYEKLYAA